MTGLSSDLIKQRMGTPFKTFNDDNGFRLVYIRGPFGKHTYFLYFSPDDKLLRFEQVQWTYRYMRIVIDIYHELATCIATTSNLYLVLLPS